jgi:hypothetical protein
MKTIVCGVDSSTGARAALRVAASLAEAIGRGSFACTSSTASSTPLAVPSAGAGAACPQSRAAERDDLRGQS